MKTPREILFKKHEAIQPRLDAIRQAALVENAGGEVAGSRLWQRLNPVTWIAKLWQELVWPYRRIWAGMAAVWMAILIFSFATDERGAVVAENSQPPTPEMKMALNNQRQMMAQLLEPGAPIAVPPRRIPGPRSEQRQTVMLG